MSFQKAHSTRIELHKVTYNPAEERFEAMVHFHVDDVIEKMAVSADLPMTTDSHTVTVRLLADARDRRGRSERPVSRILPARTVIDDLRFAAACARLAA